MAAHLRLALFIAVHLDVPLQVRMAQLAVGVEFQLHDGRNAVQHAAVAGGVHGDAAFQMRVARLVVFIEDHGSGWRTQAAAGHGGYSESS